MPSNSNYVADIGYTGFALPRANVEPLTVLLTAGDGPWTRVGPLDQVLLSSGVELPEVHRDEPSPDVGGKVTRSFEIGFALKLLSSILSVFGAKSGFKAKHEQATEADVSFESVTMDYIDLAPLDMYLGAAKVNTAARNLMLWLNDDRCVVLTNVLRSPRITMTARRSDGTEVEVELPEIAQVVEGGIKVSTTGERSSRVTFEAPDGALGVAFAFQALQLNYEGNVFHTWRTVDAAKKLRDPSASSEERDRVLSEPDVMEVPEAAVTELEDRLPEDVPAPTPA